MKPWKKFLLTSAFFALAFSLGTLNVFAAEPVSAEGTTRTADIQAAPEGPVLPVQQDVPPEAVEPETPAAPEAPPAAEAEAPQPSAEPEEAAEAATASEPEAPPEGQVDAAGQEAPLAAESAERQAPPASPESAALPVLDTDTNESGEGLQPELTVLALGQDAQVQPEQSPAANQSGWQFTDNSWYYLNPENGQAQTGWQFVDGAWYYLNPENGQMQNGWVWDGANWYYTDGSGRMQTGWAWDGANWYYTNASGAMTGGWQYVNDKWYYLTPGSGQMLTGQQIIDGTSYFLDESGAWLDDAALSGMADGRWELKNGVWYYYDASGSLHKGWLLDGGSWFFLDYNTGQMQTNWMFDGKDWFYLNPADGRMKIDWLLEGNTWYFLDPADGRMKQGWLERGGWFFLNYGSGKMATSWMYDGRDWFYLNPADGRMKVDWLLEGSNWYYLNPGDGRMKQGWLYTNSWYYLTPGNGKMMTGWLQQGNTWYYLKPENGSMVTGWYEVDDYNYYFNAGSGAMEQQILLPPGQRKITVFDIATNSYVTGTFDDIISRIVEAEVGGFNNMEVFKAQAIAAYSWLLYNREHYPGITPRVYLRNPRQTAIDATKAVSGQYLSYGGKVILAMYTASSAGVTNNAQSYFGLNLPYLAQAPDPGGATRTGQVSQWTQQQMSDAIFKMTGVRPTGDPSTWVQLYGVGGYITSATVAGKPITASKFYDNLLGLYSPYITSFTYDKTTGKFVANTKGDGHGLGMSQTGANYYAKQGYSYTQILQHYYTGAGIVKMD